MAVYVLEHLHCRNSSIFDMESVFWILVYVPLNRTVSSNQEPSQSDRDILNCIVPEDTMRLSTDINGKKSIFRDLQKSFFLLSMSCLYPYKDLLLKLSGKVEAYYDEARVHANSETWFSNEYEDRVVKEYIDEMQKFFDIVKQRKRAALKRTTASQVMADLTLTAS
jgi:hypothetical protein